MSCVPVQSRIIVVEPSWGWKSFGGSIFVGPLSRVRPRNGILGLVLVVVLVVLVLPLRSEFIGEL